MEHTNIIYLCSKEEWLEFTGTTIDESNGMHIANLKYVDDNNIRYSHTWYSKCYDTKLKGRRPTKLIVGKGREFDTEVINALYFALHPRNGVIQYGRD